MILPNFQWKVKNGTQLPRMKWQNMLPAVIKVSILSTTVCFQILIWFCWCGSHSALPCFVYSVAGWNNWESALHPEQIYWNKADQNYCQRPALQIRCVEQLPNFELHVWLKCQFPEADICISLNEHFIYLFIYTLFQFSKSS